MFRSPILSEKRWRVSRVASDISEIIIAHASWGEEPCVGVLRRTQLSQDTFHNLCVAMREIWAAPSTFGSTSVRRST